MKATEHLVTLDTICYLLMIFVFPLPTDNAQSNTVNGRHDSKEISGTLGNQEYSPKSQTSSSMSSSNNNKTNRPLKDGNDESDSSTTKADSGLLLTRTSHELSSSSSSSDHHGGGHGIRGDNGHHLGTMSTDR